MNLIHLPQAITQIRQGCDETPPGERKPFFFLVGAGISAPSIPLAGEIVQRLRTKAAEYGKRDTPSRNDPVSEYAHWFQAAFPHAKHRQKFLRDMMRDQPITHANLRLAHLLLDCTVTNLVVTPNFDDFLTRSLSLFGEPHVICDHPRTVERIDPDAPSVQIVHVHGTHAFYDCCNLQGEIEARAAASVGEYTMGSLLDEVLRRRSPLVVGYSGWEGDVVMSALQRQLNAMPRLPHCMYWFCHTRDEIGRLPDWLRARGTRADDDVCFVVPTQPTRLDAEATGTASEAGSRSRSAGQEDPRLYAREVFDALIKAFDLEAPALTRDPLDFFANQLQRSLPPPNTEETDVYFLQNLVNRLRQARERDASQALAESHTPSADALEARLEGLREAIRASRYRDAVEQLREFDLDEPLAPEHLRDLMNAAWSSAMGLMDDSDEELEAYDAVVRIGDRIEDRSSIDQVRISRALLNKGITLGRLGRHEEALSTYDAAIGRFEVMREPEPTLTETVAQVLLNKGVRLYELARYEEALLAYDTAIGRLEGTSEPDSRVAVAYALFNKGVALDKLGRHEEALLAYAAVIDRFETALEPVLRERVAEAQINKGFGALCAAKRLRAEGRAGAAQHELKKAERCLGQALIRLPDHPYALQNLGYVAFLMGDEAAARARLARAFELGGEKLRAETLDDTEIHPLPEDEDFKELIRGIPVPASSDAAD